MNDRQLKSFVQTVKDGSFSKAARNSYISTTALIQQITLLEESLGFSLFERSNRGISLTEAGEHFYQSALKILELYDEAQNYGQSLNKITLTLAVASDQYPDFLLDACNDFLKENPSVRIIYKPCPYNEQISLLKNSKADLTVIAEPKEKLISGLIYEPLGNDTYTFGMSKDNPLAKKERITIRDLKDAKILCGTYPYMKYPFERQLKKAHAEFISTGSEYDLNIRSKSLYSNDLLVFHSQWSGSYRSVLTLITSNIDAGSYGVLCGQKTAVIEELIRCFEKHIRDQK